MKLLWRLPKKRMKDTIQALTVAMALLLYPAQFCTPHPENQSLLWFSWHRAPAGPAGKAWVMDQGGFDLLAAMTEMGTPASPPSPAGNGFSCFPWIPGTSGTSALGFFRALLWYQPGAAAQPSPCRNSCQEFPSMPACLRLCCSFSLRIFLPLPC